MRCRLLTLAIAASLMPLGAGAEPSRGGVELMSPVLAEQADATALAANPAQVALLRGWSLAYVHSRVETGPTAGAGHGLFFAMPLPFGLGWGASVEAVRPDGDTDERLPWRSPFTLALAWQYARRLSIGAASRWFFCSDDPGIGGLWAVDLGVTFRLNPWVAFAITAHGVNDPRPQTLHASDVTRFGRQWSLGVVTRPARLDYLSVAAEVSYAEALGRLSVRGVAAVRPVPGWTVRADLGWWIDTADTDEMGLTLALSTELSLSMLTVGGGATVAGLLDEPGFGGYAVTASLADDGRGVLWDRPRVAQLLLEGDPTTRELATLERTLLRAVEDPSVRGVLLMPRTSWSASLAELQDIRWVLARVQRAGKPVACYLEEASGSGYFLCAGADRILLNVGGGVRLSGLQMSTLYLGEAMDRLGVAFEMIRIGEYKSSPEQLTEPGPSAEAQEQMNDYLSSVFRRYVWDLSRARGVSSQRMVEIIDGGPYLAREAREAGLVDDVIEAHELEASLEDLYGRSYRIDDRYDDRLEPRRAWRGGPAVAVIHLQGNLTDGEGFDGGPDWLRSSGGRAISRAIERAASDRSVKAIVVRIDSPGGSVLASDLIWRQVMRARKRLPVIASMGAVAASGGYYVASACDEVFALPTTMTGSIGVFYGKFELSGLMDKLGVHAFHYRRGKRAGYTSWSRPWTDDEREAIRSNVQIAYDQFLDRVVDGRAGFERREQVDAVARGRIWSGSRAKQLGLVDEIGGLQHAIERAARRAGLGRHYEVVHLPDRKRRLLERAVDLLGARASARDAVPPAVDRAMEVAAPLLFAEPETAQALLPFAVDMDL